MLRKITQSLVKWKDSVNRKPLVLRGARQVGKTYTLKAFGRSHFSNTIYLNLENKAHANLLEQAESLDELLQIIPIFAKQQIQPGKTLLIIDEIQTVPSALNLLRFFYEDRPDLHVACAGSLLEAIIKREGLQIPVGRVQYLYMFPLTFSEFLRGENVELYEYLDNLSTLSSIPRAIHNELMKSFKQFLLVGGMPEVVNTYLTTKDYSELETVYESLITGFLDDVHKYASNGQSKYLRLIIEHAPRYAGKLIKYENFADSGYHSREIKHAFSLLQAANLIQCVPGCPSRHLPLTPNLRKSPKLLFLDVGLVNYTSGINIELVQTKAIESLYQGRITEQVVGQQLQALYAHKRNSFYFWYRDATGSTAEVDFILSLGQQIIPIEVKAGKAGTLRSLHACIDETQIEHTYRISSGPYSENRISTPVKGSPFALTSIPFYLLEKFLTGYA